MQNKRAVAVKSDRPDFTLKTAGFHRLFIYIRLLCVRIIRTAVCAETLTCRIVGTARTTPIACNGSRSRLIAWLNRLTVAVIHRLTVTVIHRLTIAVIHRLTVGRRHRGHICGGSSGKLFVRNGFYSENSGDQAEYCRTDSDYHYYYKADIYHVDAEVYST